MAQWKNLNQNSSFVNPARLPFFCEISGVAQQGLTAGWQTKISKLKNFLEGCNSTCAYFKCLNAFSGLITLY